MKIIKNAVECAYCHAVIESKYRHDFVEHACDGMKAFREPGAFIAVDGGKDYLKRCGYMADMIERSESGEE